MRKLVNNNQNSYRLQDPPSKVSCNVHKKVIISVIHLSFVAKVNMSSISSLSVVAKQNKEILYKDINSSKKFLIANF